MSRSKTCFKCGELKCLTLYYKHAQMADGHLNKCKECTKKDVREYRVENLDKVMAYDRNRPNKDERRESNNKRNLSKYKNCEEYRVRVLQSRSEHSKRNPHKKYAANAVNNAIRDGKITRPDTCTHCGDKGIPIEGHHWSYLEENWLDVIWLCIPCHGKEHARLNEVERNTHTNK